MTGSARAAKTACRKSPRVTTGLKSARQELNVPIIALSQLSSCGGSREDKRPQLSDLRESGSIEQDADVVLFVFREEYYVKNMEPRDPADPKYAEWKRSSTRSRARPDVIIAKQRHGPTGTVKLAFQPSSPDLLTLADPSFSQYEETLISPLRSLKNDQAEVFSRG